MKYAVISDLHANPAALKKVLEECDRLGVDQVVCVGDVVGYGPDPCGVLRILRERNIPTVMGNHDAAVACLRDEALMIGIAQEAVRRHHAEIGADDLAWLRSLPFVYEGDGFAVAHANFQAPERMFYIYDARDARGSFVRRSEPLLFVGHTHIEALFAFGIASDPHFPECGEVNPRDFRMVDGWQYLVNAGSVGYPREHPYSSFVTFDATTRIVRFHRVPFDFQGYADALRARSLPVPTWVTEARISR